MEDKDVIVESYPYKLELEQEAAKMSASQLKQLVAYAKFLQEGHND
jgi:hypothetical protein